ncbi:MAG: ABC transporter ATP-binding protein [Acutalibacteraceae bacterium]|nr:ABC transporter ATP-binding protein [Acutalibacteraceae bacterium]
MNKKTNKSKTILNSTEILRREEQFIECYRKNNGKGLRILFGLYKGDYKNLFFSSLFFILKQLPVWVIPLITADVINVIIERPENTAKRLIIDLIIAVVVLLQNIPTHMIHSHFFSKAKRRVEAGLRGAMVRKLQQLSIGFHKEMPTGKIQSKVMRDVENVEALSTQVFDLAMRIFFDMSITLVIIISKSVPVFLMFVVCIPFFVFIMAKFRRPLKVKNSEFRKTVENTSSSVIDMIELVPVTRAHALEDKEIRKITNEVTDVAHKGYKLDFIQSLFGSLIWVVMSLAKIVCLFFTVYLSFKGVIKNVGDITLYQTYFATLLGYVNSVIVILPILTKGLESVTSIGEILCAGDIEDNAGKLKLKSLEGNYEFKNVFFKYDKNTPVLNGLSLKINKGETIALVGESGSGKSTIINMVTGFYKATSGEILIDGESIENIDLHSYRKFLSVVPQKTILFSGSVKDNITYGNPRISKERLNEVIEAAQLKSVIEKLPHGLNTSVGEHGDKLSGGQKQRIAIARAIIRDPKVIIFDEATSALDSVSEMEIQKAIDNLSKDRTTFIVAHRLSTIRNADKIAVIRDGQCVEFGTYDELMSKKGEFYNLKSLQS